MARRRVDDGATTEKPSAAERTVEMFPVKDSAPPLGSLTPTGREAAIKQSQDDAIARAKAKALSEADARMKSDETGSFTQADIDLALDEAKEREAIQAEGSVKDMSGLGDAFFGGKKVIVKTMDPRKDAEPDNIVSEFVEHVREETRKAAALDKAVLESFDEGEEVSATKGEEMYGKTGQFSSYRVGPFAGTTKVRPGETRMQARRRLMAELNEQADEERESAKRKFLAHLPTAFTS